MLIFAFAWVLAMVAPLSAAAQSGSAKIAIAVSLTGPAGTFGSPALDGTRLAVEEANASGDGPRIELVIQDDTSKADRAREVAQSLIGSDVLAVVGPSTTPIAASVLPVYAEGGLVAIGTTSTGDDLTGNATFFRASFSTSDGGEALANYAHHVLGATKAVVLVKDDAYGRPVAAGFKRAADRLGLTASYLTFDTPAEAEAVARQAAAEPNAPSIILAMIDAVPATKVLRRQGAKGPILGTNAIAGEFFAAFFAQEPEERDNPGFFANGVYAASPIIFDSANADTLAFLERFRARFGREPSYISVSGYESARLAIAAARAAVTTPGTSGDVKARRVAVATYLKSLDGPAHAVAGLNGPLWFGPARGREQALRIGRFKGTHFESAPRQLVPVRHPAPGDISSGALVEIGPGRFAARQEVVYTGIYLNEITRLDVAQSTFTADFYLWMRFAQGRSPGVADPTEIAFPTMVRGVFDPSQPSARGELDDGTTYWLWQVHGDFKNDFDLRHFPADRQNLSVRFFNSRAASDRLVYVLDQRSFDPNPGMSSARAPSEPSSAAGANAAGAPDTVAPDRFGGSVAPAAFRNLTQWEALRASERRDNLVTQSALGDPRLVGLERVRELSGFAYSVDIRRRFLTTLAKTLLPLGLMALIMYASLYFPTALVKEKVTVAITGALSGAVLLSAINAQLGNVGYLITIEYGFYAYFVLCLLCIVAVLMAERLRAANNGALAIRMEQGARFLFLMGFLGTAVAGWVAYTSW